MRWFDIGISAKRTSANRVNLSPFSYPPIVFLISTSSTGLNIAIAWLNRIHFKAKIWLRCPGCPSSSEISCNMGQMASSQRDREDFLRHDAQRVSQVVHNRTGNDSISTATTTNASARVGVHTHTLSAPAGFSPQQDGQSTTPFATFSRQISAQSIPARGGSTHPGDATTRDSIFYEQHEERPLVHMEELGMRDAPITHITATPLPRRATLLSRIGSRLMSRPTQNSAINDADSHNETSRIRRRLSRSFSLRNIDGAAPRNHNRLSIFNSLTPGASTLPRSRRRRDMASISSPLPIVESDLMPASTFTAAVQEPVVPAMSPNLTLFGSVSNDGLLLPQGSRSSRSPFSRVRRSLSTPLDSLLSTTRLSGSQQGSSSLSPQNSARPPAVNDPNYIIPPLAVTNPAIDLQGSSPNSATSLPREPGTQVFAAVPENPDRPHARADGPTWAERLTERNPGSRRESRRIPNMLRGRSSRLIRRDDEGPLPRILHLAAAAIAAQLSGTPEQAPHNTHFLGADGLDGNLATLFRTLQLATASTNDTRSPESSDEPLRLPGSQTPLNFLRVFRFVGSNTNGGSANIGTNERNSNRAGLEVDDGDDQLEGSEGRIVTLVMVGVRSVPSDHIGDDILSAEPTLDTLLNLPPGPGNAILRHGPGGLLRHADGRSRFPRRRRASMGGSNPFPANYDSQRHQRMHSASRQGSLDTAAASGSALSSALSESPPGPHPPPSTPAEPGLSAYSSGTTTPNRRPSSASALQPPPLPSRDLASQHLREAGILTPEDRALNAVQQRRRSDSEFARQRDLGAGAARRNGVVEPDEVESGESPPQGGRSWLIYVVGTNLSEDHPAFATPSLFTDVSFYALS